MHKIVSIGGSKSITILTMYIHIFKFIFSTNILIIRITKKEKLIVELLILIKSISGKQFPKRKKKNFEIP